MSEPAGWDSMSYSEKLGWLRDELQNFIAHQNAANARIITRIKVLEDAKP